MPAAAIPETGPILPRGVARPGDWPEVEIGRLGRGKAEGVMCWPSAVADADGSPETGTRSRVTGRV